MSKRLSNKGERFGGWRKSMKIQTKKKYCDTGKYFGNSDEEKKDRVRRTDQCADGSGGESEVMRREKKGRKSPDGF